MFAFARLLVNKVLLFVNRFLKPVQPITDVVDKTKAEPRIPRKYNKEAMLAAKEICIARYEAFGCAGQAATIRPMPLEAMAKKYAA
jgi:hypothetical protein